MADHAVSNLFADRYSKPVAACLIYVLILLCSGEERFYRTAVPVFMLAIYYGIKVSTASYPVPIVFVFWVAYLAIAAAVTLAVTALLLRWLKTKGAHRFAML